MNILALETSGAACSCALLVGGDVRERLTRTPRQHGRRLLPMIDELLAEGGLTVSALDAIAFGRGPGSFTGVRIAACVAQGLALAADRPVVPVSSLAALARGHGDRHRCHRVLAAFDARMGEVYLGAFVLSADGDAALEGEEQVAAPESVVLPRGASWAGAGEGWTVHGACMAARLGPRLASVDATAVAGAEAVVALAALALARGETVAATDAVPTYLRKRVATPRAAEIKP